MSTKALGVLIPTHNRVDALLECLRHLESQTFKDFEVMVVDDGSVDSTPCQVQDFIRTTPLAIRYVAQKNSGPAKARNLGISLLDAPVCLLLGDDIFASPRLLASHMRLHQQYPALELAALGLTKWSTIGQKITPFMRWLEESPIQFAYKDLVSGTPPTWHNFYSSNLSAKTELLRRFPFSEEFPFAAMEDCELGYRLMKQCGLEIKFIPEAVADHLHPTTFRQACSRMVKVGYSAKIFERLWPESRQMPSNGPKRKIKEMMARPALVKLLTTAGDICTLAICPNPVMRLALACNYEIGYHSSLDHEGRLVPNS